MKNSTVGVLLVLVLGLVVGAVGMRWYEGEGYAAEQAPAVSPIAAAPAKSKAITVEVAPVKQVSLARGVSAVGTLRSENSVMLRPEITGRIAEINFQEGGKVSRGQLLVRLDDSVAKAQLQQAQANLSLASSQYRRAQELTKQGFISKQARDESASQLKVQQAATALAKAQLEKTAILAPFDGLIGLRNVSVGDYVSPGIDLVPLESVDPLKVDFRIPEQFLGQVHVGARLVLSFDALPGQQREGEVGAISPLVDVGGRSILLRALVPNSDNALRPGMFARVRLQFADAQGLVVPETALIPSGEEQYVFRVENGHARRAVVKVGQRRAGQVEVLEGLQAGDQVLTTGLQKVRDGDPVQIRPAAASGNGLPDNS
ncbi:efflux RND transporter periplasmic adaptor subunit [Pollutimonas harenae]|uniref:Efflux RND transporter periplasmic adaptor subunit n=1 Tax=Pollutimonas harenae TaxID=657015 RepID=A0A853GPL9_9BURK|nr:efflux RND transporter periplasmic adaptor subunit [Pollutimonas harenae]NYT84031.1 efflux RND transporter periplasmic adaptor subunit [Pollutimonas harenae]TEA73543.1 efflux RND transporter periplasmic adaptor subunit [Pollutimonas harenae]